MYKISNPPGFRNKILEKINIVLGDEILSINLEKGIFNYAINDLFLNLDSYLDSRLSF